MRGASAGITWTQISIAHESLAIVMTLSIIIVALFRSERSHEENTKNTEQRIIPYAARRYVDRRVVETINNTIGNLKGKHHLYTHFI